jgi:hypothetical protein
MSPDMLSFLVAVVIFMAALITISAYYYKRAHRAKKTTWEQLMERLILVDRQKIDKIALDAIDDSGQPRRDEHAKELEASQIWQLVGGLKGVEALEHNSKIFIDMAAYLQQWHPDAATIAEDLRMSAREIEWNVERLRAGAQTEKPEISFRCYAQNAAASYYIMRRRLLMLYEGGNLPAMLSDLHKAL